MNPKEALMEAIKSQDLRLVKRALKSVDIEADRDESNVLTLAITRGTPEILENLIQSGYPVDGPSSHFISSAPLHAATKNGRADMVEVLLRCGAKADQMAYANGYTPLMMAALQGNQEIMNLLIAAGADVHAPNPGAAYHLGSDTPNTSALHSLLGGDAKDKTSMIELLLSKGADIHEVGLFQRPPLFVAIYKQDLPAVKCLIAHGANLEMKLNGMSALHCAINSMELNFQPNGSGDHIIEALLGAGAALESEDKDRQTPLIYAVSVQHGVAVSLLCKAGANVNAKNEHGNAALMKAVWNNNPGIIETLLEAGADPDAPNTDGETPISTAHKLKFRASMAVFENWRLRKACAEVGEKTLISTTPRRNRL